MWPRLRARLWPPPPQRRVPYWGHQTGPDPLWHLQPVKPTKGKGCYLTVSWQECAEWTLSGTILQCAIKDKEGYKFRRQFSWNAVSQRLWRFWIRIQMQISSLKYLTLGIPPSPLPPQYLPFRYRWPWLPLCTFDRSRICPLVHTRAWSESVHFLPSRQQAGSKLERKDLRLHPAWDELQNNERFVLFFSLVAAR